MARILPIRVTFGGAGLFKECFMPVKRSKKRAKRPTASQAYQQAMVAEGAPLALDLFGLRDAILGRKRGKASTKRRAKTVSAKVKRTRARKMSTAKKPRPRKRARRA